MRSPGLAEVRARPANLRRAGERLIDDQAGDAPLAAERVEARLGCGCIAEAGVEAPARFASGGHLHPVLAGWASRGGSGKQNALLGQGGAGGMRTHAVSSTGVMRRRTSLKTHDGPARFACGPKRSKASCGTWAAQVAKRVLSANGEGQVDRNRGPASRPGFVLLVICDNVLTVVRVPATM